MFFILCNAMKRHKKIGVIVCCVIAALTFLLAVTVLFADMALTSIIDKQLRKKASTLQGKSFTYNNLDINLLKGEVSIDSLRISVFRPATEQVSDTIMLDVAGISLNGLSLFETWRTRRMVLSEVMVESPSLSARVCRNKTVDAPTDSTEHAAVLEQIMRFMDCIGARKVLVSNGSIKFSRQDDHTAFSADSIGLTLCDIEYLFNEKRFTFNDSLYQAGLRNVLLNTADGLFAVEAQCLMTSDAGAIALKSLRARHTTSKFGLAELKGKVASTWVDAKIKELRTSPLNIVSLIMSHSVSIDSVYAYGCKIDLLRDVRYKPKEPYKMPQEGIQRIPLPLNISCMVFDKADMKVEVATADTRCGTIDLNRLQLNARNFSNEVGSTTRFEVKGRLAEDAKINVGLNLTNDKACHFTGSILIENAKGQAFNAFIDPIAGMTMDINIGQMECKMTGDNKTVTGDFCMLYDSLKVHIDKEKMPVAMVAKYSRIIDMFLSMVVPSSNPRRQGQEPFSCSVSAERDTMHNFPRYFLSPMLDGMNKTILPPNLQKKIKFGK